MKRHIHLSEEQKEELNTLLKEEKHVKIYRRLQFIQLKDQWMKNTEIMKTIPVTIDTCTDWTTLFLSWWFPALCHLQYAWRRPWKLEENKERIKQHIDDEIVPNLTSLKQWILNELSISVQESWLWEWCKKNSIVLARSWKNSQENSNPKKFRKHS